MIAMKYKECMIDTKGRFPGIGSLSYLDYILYMTSCDVYQSGV